MSREMKRGIVAAVATGPLDSRTCTPGVPRPRPIDQRATPYAAAATVLNS